MRENVIQTKSYEFALLIIKVYQKKYQTSSEKVLLRQLLASGTSVGANVEEAEGGQSKKDFISIMSIAYKEARETKYWLRLMRDSKILDNEDVNQLLPKCDELLRILTSILNTSKRG